MQLYVQHGQEGNEQDMSICGTVTLFKPVELIDTRELTNTAKHRLTQTDTGVSISWTGARTY
jgi:hypothetical protein